MAAMITPGSAHLGVGGLDPATVTFLSGSTQEPNQSTYTYSSYSIGASSAKKKFLVLGVTGHDSSGVKDVSSVTVDYGTGAQAATKLLDGLGGGVISCDLWGIEIPAGTANTTVDIVTNFSSTCTKAAIAGWIVQDYLSTTPTDTLVVNSASTTPLAGNIDVLEGGVLITFATVQNTVATYTATGVTERLDATVGTSNGSYFGGDYAAAAEEVNRSVSIAISSAQARQCASTIALR